MVQKKKLQVFISSTYTDLQEERQAAVQAILTAGHIPAGMELFAAGDEMQMNVIKRWIDESDVYMLILGGRYGSIEPRSQKSYIHLEYEYAVEKNKPLFAVVIDESHLEEKVKKDGLKAIEKNHTEKLKEFRELVCGRMVRFWKDQKDIKLAIMETMAELSSREKLIGWISGNEAINTGAVAEEMARLAKENTELRERITNFSLQPSKYNGLTYDEMYEFLNSRKIELDQIGWENFSDEGAEKVKNKIKGVANIFGDTLPSYLHYYWVVSRWFDNSAIAIRRRNEIDKKLYEYGLLEENHKISNFPFYRLTESGKQFLLKLRQDPKFNDRDLESYILEG